MNLEKNGVFINGKQQIVELLRHMSKNEKEVLLKNMSIRNPKLTHELVSQSLSFDLLSELSDHEINLVLSKSSPTIIGLALKECSQEIQRKALGAMDRDQAVTAYDVLMSPFKNEKKDAERAKEKLRLIMIDLKSKRQITSL